MEEEYIDRHKPRKKTNRTNYQRYRWDCLNSVVDGSESLGLLEPTSFEESVPGKNPNEPLGIQRCFHEKRTVPL